MDRGYTPIVVASAACLTPTTTIIIISLFIIISISYISIMITAINSDSLIITLLDPLLLIFVISPTCISSYSCCDIIVVSVHLSLLSLSHRFPLPPLPLPPLLSLSLSLSQNPTGRGRWPSHQEPCSARRFLPAKRGVFPGHSALP